MGERCWCGSERPYFAPVYVRCGGTGSLRCDCGGDICICHNHGEVQCDGCDDCKRVDEEAEEVRDG